MAEKSADVICEGKVVHRNDSLRQGFASDALAWKREEMPRIAQRWHGKERSGVAMAQQREDILLKGVNEHEKNYCWCSVRIGKRFADGRMQ
jgi:hypothetical protein